MDRHILLIDCPDAKGLVYRITGVLYEAGANIVANGEFVDGRLGHFFMRTEFSGDCDHQDLQLRLEAVLPAAARLQLSRPRRKKIVLLATREHHCLGDLLLRHAHGELDAAIAAVVSNRPDLGELVRRFELPFHCVPHQDKPRQEHEAEVMAQVAAYEPEYLVLAKYMRILTPHFIDAYPRRIVNIHHSFLPAFIGANPYRQAFERGVKIIGATAHFVTDDLDEGPIIAQSVIPVDHTHSAAAMTQAGRDVEKVVLARALQLVFEERVMVSGNRTIVFD
ncbi:MAG: formyltetrahydrofolate deformylase [Candidatus Latescibacteria bacterium]|nr:formyltetrahydrofolate deformylase [Candidatus Latescibacterota bacterium]